jgi:hypothetical protein
MTGTTPVSEHHRVVDHLLLAKALLRSCNFDGDIAIATKKGVNPLERGSQVDFMADFEEMLDFAPAPKLDVFGKLDPSKATPAEMRGQEVFFGKGQCASCHQPPFYTDNLMHDLKSAFASRRWSTTR